MQIYTQIFTSTYEERLAQAGKSWPVRDVGVQVNGTMAIRKGYFVFHAAPCHELWRNRQSGYKMDDNGSERQ